MTDCMAIDQHGNCYLHLGPYPRKELIKRLGGGHVSKMYVDEDVQIGYVIGPYWLTLFEITRMDRR